MLETINERVVSMRYDIKGGMRYVATDKLTELYNLVTDISSMILDEIDSREHK